MLNAASLGFITSFSLILAIGAQNAFVLRQGILRQHVFWICLFAAVSDAVLITAGVLGLATLINQISWLPFVMLLGGAIFLLWYGLLRFRAANLGDYQMDIDGRGVGLWKALMIMAAFTWLNPHVYLDTVGLVGTISLQFEDAGARFYFGVGAVAASFVFFFSLGYGARLLEPIMVSTRAWRILDVIIGCVMWLIALGLIVELFRGH